MKNKTLQKYLVIMLAGIVLNLGLYWLAHILHIPAWFDTIGTVYAAVTLEPATGLIIAYLTNLLESSAVYASNAIVYYAIAALCALLFGLMLRKDGRVSWKKLPLAAVIYVVAASFLSAAISMWRTGAPNSGWELVFFSAARSRGVPVFFSAAFGAGVLKVIDTAVLCVLLPILYKLTPKRFKNEYYKEKLTWKPPFKESAN